MMIKFVTVLALMTTCLAIPVEEKEVGTVIAESPEVLKPPTPVSSSHPVAPVVGIPEPLVSEAGPVNSANPDLKTDSSLWWGGYRSYYPSYGYYSYRPRYYYSYPTYGYWRRFW